MIDLVMVGERGVDEHGHAVDDRIPAAAPLAHQEFRILDDAATALWAYEFGGVD
jgi:hypothetical protein